MGFTAKRGRPKAEKMETDSGTPELQRKKEMGNEKEIIDYLAEKSIITPDQQFAASRFRYLYTVRYGLPHITAMNPEIYLGKDTNSNDEIWREKCEQEFTDAIKELKKIHAHKAVINACLFNITSTHEIKLLREGLSLLDKLWQCH